MVGTEKGTAHNILVPRGFHIRGATDKISDHNNMIVSPVFSYTGLYASPLFPRTLCSLMV